MTLDQIAFRIMLSDDPQPVKDRKLAALAKQARQAMGTECPDCGAADGLEDNGASGSELVFLCTSCDHQWGPGAEV